jgi:hypothetical protein
MPRVEVTSTSATIISRQIRDIPGNAAVRPRHDPEITGDQ